MSCDAEIAAWMCGYRSCAARWEAAGGRWVLRALCGGGVEGFIPSGSDVWDRSVYISVHIPGCSPRAVFVVEAGDQGQSHEVITHCIAWYSKSYSIPFPPPFYT